MPGLRAAQLGCLVLLVLLCTGASNDFSRYEALGHQMMCICGCNQVLIECNHVGCQDSSRMLTKLRIDVGHGDSDTTILKAFQAKYGPTALAAPMFTHFNQLAWILPPTALIFGILVIFAVVRRWKLHPTGAPVTPDTPDFLHLRDQIRKETEL